MSTVSSFVKLSPLAHFTKGFQERPLLNRAVLDTVGYALPSILLTRNPIERREQTLDRALVIGSAFFLAPLHAWAFLKLFSRNLPSEKLMWMSYKHLGNSKSFKEGLFKLAKESLQDNKGKAIWRIPRKLLTNPAFADTIRKQLIRNKTHMLFVDMLTEALIFTNMRFITNAFTRTMTGKNQFTGEYGVAKQEQLDKLHQQQNEKKVLNWSERQKQLFNNVMALVSTSAIALGLKKAIQTPNSSNPLLKGLRKIAGSFDYNKGIYLGMGALAVITALQLLGYAMAARDRYELREKMLVQNIGNYIFFLGNWTWMQLLSRMPLSKHPIPAIRNVQHAVDAVMKQSGSKLKARSAGNWASKFFWLCFLLNNLSFATLVVATNKNTTHKVKTDVKTMESKLKAQPPAHQKTAHTSPPNQTLIQNKQHPYPYTSIPTMNKALNNNMIPANPLNTPVWLRKQPASL